MWGSERVQWVCSCLGCEGQRVCVEVLRCEKDWVGIGASEGRWGVQGSLVPRLGIMRISGYGALGVYGAKGEGWLVSGGVCEEAMGSSLWGGERKRGE